MESMPVPGKQDGMTQERPRTSLSHTSSSPMSFISLFQLQTLLLSCCSWKVLSTLVGFLELEEWAVNKAQRAQEQIVASAVSG